MKSLKGISKLVIEIPPKSDCDYHCYLLSLPLLLGLRLETIPGKVPYLHADTALVKKWRARLEPVPAGKKVGLVWAGNPLHTNDHNRSIPLAEFAPLGGVEGITLISLQKGEAAKTAPPPGLRLIDYTDELTDYAETAALIANLDLVISADTSVAHLAGAMAEPVWTLLPFHPDLRWLLNRSDSPWYATMRLFRQSQMGDWKAPIEAVAEALRGLTRAPDVESHRDGG